MFSSCSWSSDTFIMGPLLFLLPNDDDEDGGGLLEAAEDGRELFLAEERIFIDFIVVVHSKFTMSLFWHFFLTSFLVLVCRQSS